MGARPYDYRAHLLAVNARDLALRNAQRRNAAAWAASRQQRALEERREYAATWGDLALRPDVHAEMVLHAERLARLNRILDIAEDTGNGALAAHCHAVIDREVGRNARVMSEYRMRFAP
jgi:hypothetical protein